MSSGQKAWAEEIEESIYERRLQALSEHSLPIVLSTLLIVKTNIELIERDSLMSRRNWAAIEEIKNSIQKLGI